jgi:hypothetical protein
MKEQNLQQAAFVLVAAGGLLLGCSGCGEGSKTPEVRIDQIEVMSFDTNYGEDPWGESGQPDFFAEVSVDDEPYYTSPVAEESAVPQRISFEGLTFQGAELDKTVVIRIFDHDDDSLDDIVGEVSFVPRDVMYTEPVRHPLYGGYLQVDLLLTW